jgi:glycosyltransferase involved in cell wall biosynthesis
MWEWLFPINLARAWIQGCFRRIQDDIELIYAYNHIVFGDRPWVVSVEWPHVLIGRDVRHFQRYRRTVEERLASRECRRILTWTDWARDSLLLNFDCDRFRRKVEVVPQAVPSKVFERKRNGRNRRILFVASANIPQAFDTKGGKEVLEVFGALSKKYKSLELVMRAKIPPHVRRRYGNILTMDAVRVVESEQPLEALEKEFINADIFLYPSHESHNTVILDAMSYELPVVTTEAGSTGRIKDGYSGLVVRNSTRIPYFWSGNNMSMIPAGATPLKQERSKALETVDPELVSELVERTSVLIENPDLARRIGSAARWEVEEGKFSIKNRNDKLKRVFDDATM